MWRLGPDGYGSISSWYQWFSGVGAPGAGFGTLKARSSSQTRCHFASISCGSYLGVIEKTSPGTPRGVPVFWPVVRGFAEDDSSPRTKKPLRGEAEGRPAQRCRACLPELGKKQLLHWVPDTSKVLELLPETALIEDGELTLGGLRASELASRHGTPLLVYCERTIRSQVQA